MLKEILLKESSKRLIDLIIKSLKNTKVKSYCKEKDIYDSLQQHLTFVNQWSSEVNFSDLKHSKLTRQVFVHLDLYFQPLRIRVDEEETIEKFELSKIFKVSDKHIALLGQVGSGKTTSVKYLCQSLLFNEGLYENNFSFPIVIKLNDFNSFGKDSSKSLIYNEIIKILGIKFDFQNLDEPSIDNFKEQIAIQFLNENNVLLFLDGFDEISFKNRRELVLTELTTLVTNVEKSRIVITSRTSDFKFAFSNISVYEISPLTDNQIQTFAEKWLGNVDEANDFLEKIKKSPFYDTAIRPLTIAHLCALYERNKNIPEKPKTVYRKIVMLLLEDWNQQRNIHRNSKYASFENDRKFEFLTSLAYHLTIANNSSNFFKGALELVYQKIYQDFDLIKNEMLLVIEELESHNGLILQSGFQKFQFAHKSIQEYLSAEYIVKLPTIPNQRNQVLRLPNEFAVAIAISSRPSEYFTEFVFNRVVPMKFGLEFIKPFINRLLLEKVDFNKQASVSMAAMVLYSQYIKALKEESKQIRLFLFDDLLVEFEKFINEIFKRNDREELFTKYLIKEEIATAEGDTICLLNLKKDIKPDLPTELFCRKTFMS